MSKLQEAFRAIRIHNTWEVCVKGGGKVYVDYYNGGTGRGSTPNKWVVVGVNGHKTDPTAHWLDNGCKVFLGNMRSPAFEEAKKWASEKYGIAEWVRDPFGGWQDAKVLARAKELATSPVSPGNNAA